MPRGQIKPNIQRNGRQSLMLKSIANEGKQPHDIEHKQLFKPIRKSVYLQEIQYKTLEQKTLLPSPSATNSFGEECPQDSPALENPPNSDRKRKRSQETKYPTPEGQEEHTEKRVRTSLESYTVEDKEAVCNIDSKKGDLINHWIQEGCWPKEYFKQDRMDLLPRKKKSFASLQDENSEAKINISCEGGDGTQAARNLEYEKQLTVASIFLEEDAATISKDDKDLCTSFLNANQLTPMHSLFQDSLFKNTASRYLHRSETMVFRDITPLITPSAELLHVFGSTHLAHVREDINAIWTKCICLASGPRPKPDFAVGLKSSAFTGIELQKLTPYVGGPKEICFIKVTNDIFFPFLTCEAKCGEVGLTVADRQNAHSASIAVNAVVQLYKAVSREKEINKKILAFSISHDNETVRIYGHYALIQEDKISFYRYAIHKFDLTALDGKEKWTAYTFTKNLYDKFLPLHLERVKSAIIQLPDPKTFLISSFTSIASVEDESELPDSQKMATSAPASQDREFKIPELPRAKKQKLPPKAMLEQEVERLKEQNKQEREQSNQRHRELMDLLKGQEDRQKEQMDQQKQQMDRQKQQMDQQMDQQKDQMDRQIEELKREKDEQRQQIQSLIATLATNTRPHAS
ncbi:MAG: hypothetical protein MMC33_005100 [Icmadophila ericetorum]|nr:hypothetical protein [Icmadophila ericetorum]